MTVMIICGVLIGFILGAAVSFAVKPRRDPDPKVRKLLDDYATAVSMSLVAYGIDHPNLLNKETREAFEALRTRYIKELTR